MDIQRYDDSGRFAQMVVSGDTVHLAGQVADDWDADAATQARQVLDRIDALLERAGSSRSHVLSMNVWLADLADYATFNAAYDAWVDPAAKPARATVQAPLIDPRIRVEVMLVAAQPRSRTAADLVADARAAVPRIGPEEAIALHASGDARFIDVREANEHAAGHVPGARHVPRGLLEFEIDKHAGDPDGPLAGRLIMVCGGGGRAALAARAARQLGLDAVLLDGGQRAWEQAGGPIED